VGSVIGRAFPPTPPAALIMVVTFIVQYDPHQESRHYFEGSPPTAMEFRKRGPAVK
jgi:hypothetical protein